MTSDKYWEISEENFSHVYKLLHYSQQCLDEIILDFIFLFLHVNFELHFFNIKINSFGKQII